MSNTRVYEWSDPTDVVRGVLGREHLDWMRAMLAGEISAPPFAQTLGLAMQSVEPGRITFAATAAPWMCNPAGIIHGGLAATLLDSVVTLAVMSKLPAQKLCTTLDLNVHFVRPLFPNGVKLVADGVAVHIGTTVGTAEGRLHDEKGRLIAHGTASLAIVDADKLHR